jgi:uncharacterized short protein YbdD (DUF466 family)
MAMQANLASRMLRRFWRGLREWCGDNAYECYLRAARRNRLSRRIMTPEEFYADQLQRRYSRPNRCC